MKTALRRCISIPSVHGRSCTRLVHMTKMTRIQRENLGGYCLPQPTLRNPWTDDDYLQRVVKMFIPPQHFDRISADLTRFGDRIVSEVDALGRRCELESPRLEQYDAWGRRQNRLLLSTAWTAQKAVAAQERLIAVGYECNDASFEEFRRIYQYAKLFMYAPASGLYSCPLAMTDGCAKVIKELKLDTNPLLKNAFDHLTSGDEKIFWTSGQWMTERMGGSDVAGGTDTVAFASENDSSYRLFGNKWFSSATDADVALTLARISDANGHVTEGSKGLTLFFLHVRDPETGALNDIDIVRLKDKLGTRQLPTAELLLHGTKAFKVSDDGRGVAAISHMLNITRLHNAVASVSAMRRILSLSRDYCQQRTVFGRKLCDWPLHVRTMTKLEVECRACTLFVLETARLLALQECDIGDQTMSAEEAKTMLRFATPLLKLYTAKRAMSVVSEGLENFGGQGYLEDTGLPSILRDTQVTPIWEGTTNVLSLDVLRIIGKQRNAMTVFSAVMKRKMDAVGGKAPKEVALASGRVLLCLKSVTEFLDKCGSKPEMLQLAARDFAMSLAEIYIGSLLVQHSMTCGNPAVDGQLAKSYISHMQRRLQHGMDFDEYSATAASRNAEMFFENKSKL